MKMTLALLLVIFSIAANAQERPFWKEIGAFRKSDSIHFPAPRQILFVGSSSFRLWSGLQDYFPGYPIINRGFGGSTLKDVNFYFSEIIRPYQARQIIVYGGDNDFFQDNTLPVDSVVRRFELLVKKIRAVDLEVQITFISIKPSPSRMALNPKFVAANDGIARFVKKQKNMAFVDVHSKMMGKNGKPIKSIFLADSLHMNAQGYVIWQKAIRPLLLKN